MARVTVDILAMSPAERLELIGELWDSLEADDVELSPEQQAELDRRLDSLEATGPTGAPWHEVEIRIRARSS